MSISPTIKGWCPGAYRPMMSGDGLVVRIRPTLARFPAEVLRKVCALAEAHGNGILELTNRANLQLRGVTDDHLPALLAALGALNLLDADPALEGRRNILTQPFWRDGHQSARLSTELRARLSELPDLPAKFGFAIDTGTAPLLSTCSADIRLERDADGGLILRADGCATGCTVTDDNAIDQIIELAHWFAQTAPSDTKRMAKLLARTPLPAKWTGIAPAAAKAPLRPGQTKDSQTEASQTARGQQVALPFGQIQAADLAHALRHCTAIRVTPFRVLILEGASNIQHPALITDPGDPLLRVDACPGAPRCASASVETHTLARQLAPQVSGRLHVSGCSKGCARNAPADLTLIGRDGLFDIVHDGTAQATPTRIGLTPHALLTEMT